ncbi:MAG: carbohydrate ABC transporter permease [bacterium]
MIRLLRRYAFEIVCLCPLVLFLLIFTLVPIIQVFLISLREPHTAGLTLAHYRTLLSHREFHHAFFNTLFIAIGSLCLEIFAGLLLAMILAARIKGTGILKSLFMLPLAIPTVVAAVMMSYLFSTSGWINRILLDLGIIHAPVMWLQGGVKSLFTIMAADSWKVTPLVMLILLAGLQSIDRDLYKAARIDGAGGWYTFRRVTLPLLMPCITAAVIIRGIDAFRIFSLALILMGENLKVIGTYAYLEYAEYNNPYLSAASAVILFLMIMGAVFLYIKAAGKKGVQAA